jgi:acyl carrier protein
MTENEIFEKLKALIVELLEVDGEKVLPEASFEDDFEADSLDLLEFITAAEDTFKIEISDEEAENIKTVQDAINYIKPKIK